ncbi:MAG: hypothetical protein ACI8YI_002149, partial [Paracoccaceae bacterium]
MKLLKTLHGWLGFFVMPWIIMIGLTGLYLNHSKLVSGLLPTSAYDEARFDDWQNPQALDQDAAKAVAVGVFPGDNFKLSSKTSYHNRDVHMFDGESGRVIVAAASGHYWVKTRFTRKTYDPDGRSVDSKIYWGSAFKTLHARGWITSGLGTWLADITAGAMVFFGLSGIFLFLAPKLRRRNNRHDQVTIKRSDVV